METDSSSETPKRCRYSETASRASAREWSGSSSGEPSEKGRASEEVEAKGTKWEEARKE